MRLFFNAFLRKDISPHTLSRTPSPPLRVASLTAGVVILVKSRDHFRKTIRSIA